MSKEEEKTIAQAIIPGKPIKVEASTRAEANKKVEELRKQAEADGLTETSSGFVFFDPEKEGDNAFSAILMFQKK